MSGIFTMGKAFNFVISRAKEIKTETELRVKAVSPRFEEARRLIPSFLSGCFIGTIIGAPWFWVWRSVRLWRAISERDCSVLTGILQLSLLKQ
jgi:hypothetical protein